MNIQRLTSRNLGANCYLVTENGHAFLIDPCEKELLAPALTADFALDFILLTHEHADHIYGVNWLRERCDAPVICSEKCAVNMEDTRMNYSYYYETTKRLMGYLPSNDSSHIDPFTAHADNSFSADTRFRWQGHEIFAKLTPGHSAGGASYLIDGKILFAGDTMFKDKPTTTGFKGGSRKEFAAVTLPWLTGLPPDTEIYPGHFEPFILKEWSELKG